MRKIICILGSMVLLVSLTACAGQREKPKSFPEDNQNKDSARQEKPIASTLAEETRTSPILQSSSSHDSVFPWHEPYGEGIGAMPGRVVWVYDTDSVSWDGDGYWWQTENFDEATVQHMVNDSIASNE